MLLLAARTVVVRLNPLSDCLQDIFHTMTDSKLKLNTNKTEFLIIGTQKQRGKLECFFPTPLLSQNFTPAVSAFGSELWE